MIYTTHDIFDPDDRHARPVMSLLAPSLNRDGFNADNLELDSRIMLAGTLVAADATFVQGCLTACIEPDSFAPGSRVAVMSTADFARWQAIRAAFVTANATPTPLATLITR